MKAVKIISFLLLIMLTCGACIAETADASDNSLHKAVLLPVLEMAHAEWMEDSLMRAVFAVFLQVELSAYPEECDISTLMNESGMPEVYLADGSGADAGDIIKLYMFYPSLENAEYVRLFSGSYRVSTGEMIGSVEEVADAPAAIMEALLAEGTEISAFYPVTSDEYYTAILTVNSMINGEGDAAQ